MTMVDADFWEAWVAANKDFPAMKSGAIFTVESVADADVKAKELEKEKIGFEGLDQKAHGVEPADKE